LQAVALREVSIGQTRQSQTKNLNQKLLTAVHNIGVQFTVSITKKSFGVPDNAFVFAFNRFVKLDWRHFRGSKGKKDPDRATICVHMHT
jgi:hypothetical protein